MAVRALAAPWSVFGTLGEGVPFISTLQVWEEILGLDPLSTANQNPDRRWRPAASYDEARYGPQYPTSRPSLSYDLCMAHSISKDGSETNYRYGFNKKPSRYCLRTGNGTRTECNWNCRQGHVEPQLRHGWVSSLRPSDPQHRICGLSAKLRDTVFRIGGSIGRIAIVDQ
eukprot:3729974-Prymnesium_polylepis.1